MSKDTQFKEGYDERRSNAGRKPGSPNKMKSTLEDAWKKADRGSGAAVEFLKDVMEGDITGASVTNRITCAVKVLELSEKYKEAIEEKLGISLEPVADSKPKEEETPKPLISLTSQDDTARKH